MDLQNDFPLTDLEAARILWATGGFNFSLDRILVPFASPECEKVSDFKGGYTWYIPVTGKEGSVFTNAWVERIGKPWQQAMEDWCLQNQHLKDSKP